MELVVACREIAHTVLRERYQGIAKPEELEHALEDVGQHVQVTVLAYKFLKHVYSPREEPLTEGLVSCGNGVLAVSPDARERFGQVVKAAEQILAAKGNPHPVEKLASLISGYLEQTVSPAFLRRCAEISEKIGLDDSGRIGLKRWSHFNPQTIEQIACSTLKELGQPAHFRQIISKMNELFPKRSPFKMRSVHNCLTSHPGIFVSLGHGKHGLRTWGIKRSPYIYNFLIDQLRSSPKPLHQEELIGRGVAQCGYPENSIKMTLTMNPHVFKESRKSVYTLTERFKVHRPVKAIWKKRRRPPKHRR
jgi:hypothetical protein